MKIKIKIRVPSISLDWLLLAAIVGLLAVLFWPAIEAWQNRPQAGVQVCQEYVEPKNNDSNVVAGHVNYLLYLPREYGVDRKWPLVVFLHGAGERGEDLAIVRRLGPPWQIDQGKQLPFILVSPQCPMSSDWSPEHLIALIKHIGSRFSVDLDRVYLTGYSMGGFATWETACYDPDRFAAIAPLAGGGDVTQAKRLVNLPIWAFHGAKDETVSTKASKTMVDAVRKCGGHVEFTVHPDYGHDICWITYQDRLYDWLLAQRRPQHIARRQQ
jgi:predicted peptidase